MIERAANQFGKLRLEERCFRWPRKPFPLLFETDVHAIFGLCNGCKVRPMANHSVDSSRVGAVKERGQAKNPVTGRYVKIDTETGRIIDHKKTPGPYKGVRVVERKK